MNMKHVWIFYERLKVSWTNLVNFNFLWVQGRGGGGGGGGKGGKSAL